MASLDDTPLEDDVAPLGYQRGHGGDYETLFGIRAEDRISHLLITGKMGRGKSVMLENLMVRDIAAGHSFAFIDPHGTNARALLNHIPLERIKDVIYLNVADHLVPQLT